MVSKNDLLDHPAGGVVFGSVVGVSNSMVNVEGAPIVLRAGIECRGGSFGAAHIWARHQHEMIALGYGDLDDVPLFVASIIVPNADVLRDRRRPNQAKLIALNSAVGMAVLQVKQVPEIGRAYSIITAFTRRTPLGPVVSRIA